MHRRNFRHGTFLPLNYIPIVLLRCFFSHEAGFDLGLRNGMVVAVPNPSPMAGGGGVDAAIHLALEEANAKGLKGRDITPFVLASVNETTGGQSLKSNVALVRLTIGAGAYYSCFILSCFVVLLCTTTDGGTATPDLGPRSSQDRAMVAKSGDRKKSPANNNDEQ